MLRTRDIKQTADLIVHTELRTTERYMRAVEPIIAEQSVSTLTDTFQRCR